MNSLKSIMSRITSVPEAVEQLDNIGISTKSAGEMRDFDDILDDLGGTWNDLSNEQQQNVALSVAGRHHLSRFLILMERYEDAIKAADTATHSANSAQRENERYLESYEAKINRVKNTWTETTIAMQEDFLGDGIVAFTEVATTGIGYLTTLIEKFGVLPMVFGAAGLSISLFNKELRNFFSKGMFSVIAQEFDKASRSQKALNIKMTRGAVAARTYSAGATAAGVATRTLTAALRGLVSAFLPLMVFSAIGYAISKVTGNMIENKMAADELTKQLEESQKASVDAVTTNKDQVDKLLQTYQALNSQRNEDGSFVDVETEQEYLRVTNELAEIFPSIVSHIDSKGNAHLKNAEAIKEELEWAERLAQADRDQQVADAKDDFRERLKDVKKYQKEIKKLEDDKRKEEEFYEMSQDLRGEGIHTLTPEESKEIEQDFKDRMTGIEAEIVQHQYRIASAYGEIGNQASGVFSSLSYDLEQANPHLTKFLDEFIKLMDWSKLGDEDDFVEIIREIHGIGIALDELYKGGQELEFDELVDSLNNRLEELGLDEKLDKITLSYEKLSEGIETTENSMEFATDALGEHGEAADGANESIEDLAEAEQELSEIFNESIGSIEKLNGVLNELDGDGLSAKTIGMMIEDYPELLVYMDDEAALRAEITKLIEEQSETAEDAMDKQIQQMADKLMTDENYYSHLVSNNNEAINKIAEAYDIDLDNFVSLAKAKEEVENRLLTSLTDKWNEYVSGVQMTAEEMKKIVGDAGGMTDYGRTMFGKLSPEEQVAFGFDLAEYQQGVKKLSDDFNGLFKADFSAANAQFHGVGNSIRNAGRDLEKAGEKGSKAAKDTAREHKLSKYVADAYAQSLEQINHHLERQAAITKKFPTHSKEYRDSLQKEINLLQSKSKIIGQQSRDLERQIKSGNITQTGIVDAGSVWSSSGSSSVSSGGSKSIASYYLDNFRITSRFGRRKSPGGIGSTNHKGLDLANGRYGDPVKALAGGKVIGSAFVNGAGNMVTVQQDDGMVAKYMHMQNLGVRVGQRIEAGSVLGGIGSTGNSTGAHLHLQLEKNGVAIDPEPILKQLKSGSGGGGSSGGTSAAQMQADASRARAEQQQSVDQAKSDLLGMQGEMASIADQVEELYFSIIESHIEQFDHAKSKLEKNLAKIDYYQTRYDEGSTSWMKQQAKREEVMRKQNKIHKDSIKWIEKEIKTNKNLTKAQRMRLDDILLERQTEMWNLEKAILEQRISMAEKVMDTYKKALEAHRDAALKSVDNLLDEIDKKEREDDYKKRLEKTQRDRQDILDEISAWSIDGSDEAKKKIKELTEELQKIEEEIDEMQHDKGIEDRKEALNKRKDSINEEYDYLINSEKAFADMRSKIINNNTKDIQKKLNTFYKQIGKMTDELGKATVENLRRSIKQMNSYLSNSKTKRVSVPTFHTGGMVKARGEGLILAKDKEIVLNNQDSKNILESAKMSRSLFSNIKKPRTPDLLANTTTTQTIIGDIVLHVGSMNGSKKDANMVLDRIAEGLQRKGVKFN